MCVPGLWMRSVQSIIYGSFTRWVGRINPLLALAVRDLLGMIGPRVFLWDTDCDRKLKL